MQPVGAEAVPDSPKIRRQTLYKRKRSVLNKAFLREEGGNRRLTEGACVGLKFDVFYSCALSSTRFAGAPSRREPNGKRITKAVPDSPRVRHLIFAFRDVRGWTTVFAR